MPDEFNIKLCIVFTGVLFDTFFKWKIFYTQHYLHHHHQKHSHWHRTFVIIMIVAHHISFISGPSVANVCSDSHMFRFFDRCFCLSASFVSISPFGVSTQLLCTHIVRKCSWLPLQAVFCNCMAFVYFAWFLRKQIRKKIGERYRRSLDWKHVCILTHK